MKQILKIAGIVVFLLLLTIVTIKLFYPDLLFNKQVDVSDTDYTKNLTIGLSGSFQSMEPTLYDSANRQRLLQIYEPLVMPDKDLNIKPVLALSFGQIDEQTWKFRLKENVKFHNGENLTSDDVIESIRRAKNHEDSQLKDILQNISTVKKLSDTELEIELLQPDPLFLNKISTVLIVPAQFQDNIGTGPYMFADQDDSILHLKRNDLYWDRKPTFKVVNILSLDTLDKWVKHASEIDLGYSFPASLKDKSSKRMVTVPSLEVTYLAFNFTSPVFKDIDLREATRLSLDVGELAQLLDVKPASQFVSSGVYGFNPEIELPERDTALAKSYVKAFSPFYMPKATLDALYEQEVVANHIKNQLSDIGIDLAVNLLTFDELEEKILARKSDMYLLGFKSELGDSYDFYRTAVVKNAKYNGGNYSSDITDSKISASLSEMKPKKRLKLLRDVMDVLINDDIYGVPLYETQSTYAISSGLKFEPRLDSYVLVKEIK